MILFWSTTDTHTPHKNLFRAAFFHFFLIFIIGAELMDGVLVLGAEPAGENRKEVLLLLMGVVILLYIYWSVVRPPPSTERCRRPRGAERREAEWDKGWMDERTDVWVGRLLLLMRRRDVFSPPLSSSLPLPSFAVLWVFVEVVGVLVALFFFLFTSVRLPLPPHSQQNSPNPSSSQLVGEMRSVQSSSNRRLLLYALALCTHAQMKQRKNPYFRLGKARRGA